MPYDYSMYSALENLIKKHFLVYWEDYHQLK